MALFANGIFVSVETSDYAKPNKTWLMRMITRQHQELNSCPVHIMFVPFFDVRVFVGRIARCIFWRRDVTEAWQISRIRLCFLRP